MRVQQDVEDASQPLKAASALGPAGYNTTAVEMLDKENGVSPMRTAGASVAAAVLMAALLAL